MKDGEERREEGREVGEITEIRNGSGWRKDEQGREGEVYSND